MSLRAHFARGGTVAVSEDGVVLAETRESGRPDLLALLDRTLAGLGRGRGEITEIAVDRGPDGFSAVRARVAVATGLAAALRASMAAVGPMTSEEAAALPKRDFRKTARVLPLYDAEPNITTGKKPTYGRR